MVFRLAGFRSWGAWALLLHNVWNLPRPGIKPMFPALADGFLSTVPPGKSNNSLILVHNAQFLYFPMHVDIPKMLPSSVMIVTETQNQCFAISVFNRPVGQIRILTEAASDEIF